MEKLVRKEMSSKQLFSGNENPYQSPADTGMDFRPSAQRVKLARRKYWLLLTSLLFGHQVISLLVVLIIVPLLGAFVHSPAVEYIRPTAIRLWLGLLPFSLLILFAFHHGTMLSLDPSRYLRRHVDNAGIKKALPKIKQGSFMLIVLIYILFTFAFKIWGSSTGMLRLTPDGISYLLAVSESMLLVCITTSPFVFVSFFAYYYGMKLGKRCSISSQMTQRCASSSRVDNQRNEEDNAVQNQRELTTEQAEKRIGQNEGTFRSI